MRIEWWEIDQVGKLDQLLCPMSKWRSRTGFWTLAKVTLVAVGRMDWRELDQEHRVQKGSWSLGMRWRRPPARKGCKQALMVQKNMRQWLSESRQKVKGKSLGCFLWMPWMSGETVMYSAWWVKEKSFQFGVSMYELKEGSDGIKLR